MGVWIEINCSCQTLTCLTSLPSWECGLKFYILYLFFYLLDVTPFMGVWIEILFFRTSYRSLCVTPFMGVWIEIQAQGEQSKEATVTPFMGVWIEIIIAI